MVAPIIVPLLTQDEINHKESTIQTTTYNMNKQIEDEPLLWCIPNAVVDSDTVEIIQCKYLMNSKW